MNIDPQWVEAIGTLLAVIVALGIAVFQDSMRAWISRPKLDVSISLTPPDCHKIPITLRHKDRNEPLEVTDSYYLTASHKLRQQKGRIS